MKTPIQELIDKWEQEKGSYIPNAPIFQEFINDAKKMLEQEREVIMEAYWEGGQDVPVASYRCEEYFNKTFNNEDQ